MSAPFGPMALTLGDITRQIHGTLEAFTDLDSVRQDGSNSSEGAAWVR